MIRKFVARPIVVAVSSCFAVSSVYANPTGPQIVSGTVSMQRPDGRTLNVTNSPGSIINWQGFSIGAGEITRFIQQSSSSAVLNRVVGADISQIHGQLLSNGRVFLINPAGIIIGGGAIVDTAGFVASTLGMTNADFLAGKLKFQGDASSGSIVNQGLIRTSFGGNVVLVAPHVENSGLIQTPGGELILAAGQKMTIGSLDYEGVHFELQAPTDSVLNVGKLLADGGAVGVFAGTLKHTGDVRANALVRDEGGRVVLKAQSDATVSGNATVSATGKSGGNVQILADRVRLEDNAAVDVSGETRGGSILIGGDYQGANAAIQNASANFIGANAMLRADATVSGDGGRIIVWSDRTTRYHGALSARGAGPAGKGGFAEVSGKENLLFTGKADLGAPSGRLGDLLLDPLDNFVTDAGGLLSQIADDSSDVPLAAVTVTPATLAAVNGNVSLYAGRYLRIIDPITLTTAGQGLSAQVGTYTPGDPLGTFTNQLDLAANITTNNGAVSLTAPRIQSVGSRTIATTGGAITLNSTGATIQAGGLSLDAGTGAVNASSTSSVQLGTIAGGSINLNSSGSFISTDSATAAGGNVVANAATSINMGAIASGGGPVSLTANTSTVTTGGINAGSGTVAVTGTSINAFGAIDTTAGVTLNATAGNIFATVDNAASLTATATRSTNASVNINIGSNTALNANTVTATSNACPGVSNCPSASVSLNANGNVNVGTVRASGMTGTSNNIGETVSISSNTGSILAMNASSQVTATDVSLLTGQGSGGGIGSAATPLNVDVRRTFTFAPNGAFNTVLNGPAPNRLTVQIGVAPTGQNYLGTLVRTAGGINLAANVTDTTVTLDPFAPTGFNQRVNNSNPFITLRVPNGALFANSITVPEGDTTVPNPPFVTTAPLPVSISAFGDLTLNNYTRQSTAASLAKTTTISSDTGNVALGTINASKDALTVFANGNVSITSSTIATAGNVNVTSSNANVTIGQIDTTSGAGSVNVNAINGTVGALNDSVALEILSGSTVSVNARTIGTAAFNNPLDIAGTAVTLTASQDGSRIGSTAAPVVANTANLTINAANNAGPFVTSTGGSFNVSTGPIALRNLTVRANPAGVASGGVGSVRTEVGQPNDTTYQFTSDGANFTLPGGTVPATQFVNGSFSFTSNSGNIVVNNATRPTASVTIDAQDGSITGGATLDAAALTLRAGTQADGAGVGITVGDIGTSVRPATFTATAGNNNFTNRAGTIDTGSILADAVTLTTANGRIRVGPTGTGTIGSAATPAGAVILTADRNSASNASGTIDTGDIFATTVTATSHLNTVTLGNVRATDAMTMRSNEAVTLGAVDGQSLTVTNDGGLFSPGPQVTTGAIGTITPLTTISIFGETHGGPGINVLGPIVGAATAQINIGPGGRNGQTLLGGPVTTGAGGNVNINHRDATPFRFTTIDTTATGRVSLSSSSGIEQTADAAGNGITAGTIFLTAENGAVTNTADAAQRTDLTSVSALTVNGSTMRFDAHGSILRSLNITKNGTVAAAPFELANLGSAQVVTMGSAPTDMTLVAQSPNAPLDVTLDNRGGGIALGAGMITSGGNVFLTAQGPIDASNGGITTGGATGGGSVTLITPNGGGITTGAINTTPIGTGTGQAIFVESRGVNGDINVNGNLQTGPGGAGITVSAAFEGSITRTGGATISSPSTSSVTLNAADGNIGSAGTPMLVTSPNATISARLRTAGRGSAFATLTGTNTLSLTGENGFTVASDTAFTTLSAATRGTGTDALSLTAPGQSYNFARPTTDLFGAAITNTFQVIDAGGAGAPPTSATFNAVDGDLLITAGATLASPQLVLGSTGSGDVKLQGTAATPFTLNTTTTQTISSPRDLILSGTVNLSSPTQTLNPARDLLATGNIALTSTGTQTLASGRHMTMQAQGGTIAITAPTQSISARTFAGVDPGAMTFTGGNLDNETVTITGTSSQHISTPANQGGDLILQAGSGNGSNVSVVYTGPNTGTQQLIEVRGNIGVRGGSGMGSTALITTGAANQSQIVRAGLRTGEPLGAANGNIDVTAGSGAGSTAGITNTGTGLQQVGESHQICGIFGCFDIDYQTRNITVAGNGANASAQIAAAGTQRLYSRGGTITVVGGAQGGATAKIESTNATIDQRIGLATDFETGNQLGALTVQGGAGAGATALVSAASMQRVTTTGATSLLGTTAGANSSSTLQGAGQDIRAGSIAMTGGNAPNAFSRILSSVNQTVRFGSITMTAGTADGASVTIDTPGTQTFTRFGGSGAISLTGAGNGNPTALAGATALIEGQSQSFCATGTRCGAVTLTGGAGTADATSSDALLRNLSGSQQLVASSLTLTGGNQFNTTGVLNQGTGTQTINTTGGITLRSDNVNPAQTNAAVRIDNQPATNQTINAQFVDVVTLPGSSATTTARIMSGGNQWIHTSNGGMQIAALGAGTANLVSGATQLLEVDYPVIMTAGGVTGLFNVGQVSQRLAAYGLGATTAAAGTSRADGVNQTIYAGGLTIQGPANPNQVSKLGATTTQTISVVVSGLQVLGGSGANTKAIIDPTDQTIVVTGPFTVMGGTAPNATASIESQGVQNLVSSSGPITLTGGTAPGASATLVSSGPSTVTSTGPTVITPNIGGAGVTSGALPSTSSSAAESEASSQQTHTLLTDQTRQNDTLSESNDDVDVDLFDPRRRSQQTEVQLCS